MTNLEVDLPISVFVFENDKIGGRPTYLDVFL